MGRAVSLFSGYSQKENRVTNYTLLVLKMLYEENQKYLGEVLAALVGEDMSSHVGVVFRQQEKGKRVSSLMRLTASNVHLRVSLWVRQALVGKVANIQIVNN